MDFNLPNIDLDPRKSSVGQAISNSAGEALGGAGGWTIGSVLGSLLGPAGTLAGGYYGQQIGKDLGGQNPYSAPKAPSASPVGQSQVISAAPSQIQRSSLANEERNRAAQRAALPKNTEFAFNLENNPFSKSAFSK